jgi:hypothetical protein
MVPRSFRRRVQETASGVTRDAMTTGAINLGFVSVDVTSQIISAAPLDFRVYFLWPSPTLPGHGQHQNHRRRFHEAPVRAERQPQTPKGVNYIAPFVVGVVVVG